MNFNGRKLLTGMKQHKWGLILAGLTIALYVGSAIVHKNRIPVRKDKSSFPKTENPFGVQLEESNIDLNLENSSVEPEEKKKSVPQPKNTPIKIKQKKPVSRPTNRRELPPIVNIFTKPPKKNITEVSDRYAPYGRQIECELVMTIDSASTETPIIGIVTRDLYHAGKLIIPAGVEVHGRANGKPVRDRIMTGNQWIFVWRTKSSDNGKELKLKGIALTKEAMLATNSWHLYDGSAGIRGEVIKSDEMNQLLAYGAEFVATFTGSMVQEEITTTTWGQTVSSSGSVQDAVNEGISSAVRKYADQLAEEIKQNGYFVRCTAGTQFYIYIQEPIDLAKAEIAGSRVTNDRRK